MIVEAGRRAHLVRSLPEPPKNPPQFAMLLRKYISGGKVLAIRQHGLERILIFDIGKGLLTYRLIIELFDEGNVILTDENYLIVKPLRHHRFRDREVVPGSHTPWDLRIPRHLSKVLPWFLQQTIGIWYGASQLAACSGACMQSTSV